MARRDKDLGPFTYWASSQELFDEILNYNIVGVIDLTAGCGRLAQSCISNTVPYLGVCYTEHHRDLLKRFLNQVAFTMKSTEGHRLYSPELAKLCKASGAVSQVAQGKAMARGKPKGKATPKPKAGGAPEKPTPPLSQKSSWRSLRHSRPGATRPTATRRAARRTRRRARKRTTTRREGT